VSSVFAAWASDSGGSQVQRMSSGSRPSLRYRPSRLFRLEIELRQSRRQRLGRQRRRAGTSEPGPATDGTIGFVVSPIRKCVESLLRLRRIINGRVLALLRLPRRRSADRRRRTSAFTPSIGAFVASECLQVPSPGEDAAGSLRSIR
jgi:hypothetical protein